MFIIREFRYSDKSQVIQLWNQLGLATPQNNSSNDIDRKLKVNPELFLVAVIDDLIIGSIMGGYEGHRGWINYLGVSPHHQRSGVASRLMASVEQKMHAIGCAKINLQVRNSNTDAIKFYQSLGYLEDQVVSFGKRLEGCF